MKLPDNPRLRLGLALLAGLLTPLSLAPFGFWPVSLLTTALFALLLQGRTAREGFFTGWAYGAGLWGSGVAWLWVSIHDYGYTPAWLATLMVAFVAVVMGLLSGLQGWIYARLKLDRQALLGFPALWALFEWLRSWLFTGFPWLYLGYAYIDTPLSGFAPVGGVFLVSLLVVLTSVGMLQLLRPASSRQRAVLATALASLWAVGLGLQQIEWTRASGNPVSISIIQGNIPQDMKWNVEMQDQTIAIYEKLSEKEWGRDVVLWPEAAITKFLHEAIPDLERIDARAAASHSAFVTGIPYLEPGGPPLRFFNSVLAVGDGRGLYHKQRLVPFGEYIPFEDVLRGALPFFDMPMSSFSWGSDQQQPLAVKSFRLQPSICYEIAYPGLVRRQALGADMLVTVSNDAWFGGSHGPHQHFEMVRMRALETGRYILRGTNNGISAIIDNRGRVVSRAPQFVRTVLRGEARTVEGLTPWLVMGNVLILTLSGVMMALAWRRAAKRAVQNVAPNTSQNPGD